MNDTALLRIPVGVIAERRSARSPWVEHVHRPLSILLGVPDAEPGTPIGADGEAILYYAGESVVELYRTETSGYLDNLSSAAPLIWVALQSSDSPMGFVLRIVTADPAEGEALTGSGTDVVDTVPMPEALKEILVAFVSKHHVELTFVKRQRRPAEHEARRQETAPARDGS